MSNLTQGVTSPPVWPLQSLVYMAVSIINFLSYTERNSYAKRSLISSWRVGVKMYPELILAGHHNSGGKALHYLHVLYVIGLACVSGGLAVENNSFVFVCHNP